MINLFMRGGPVMWPLLATSLVTVAVVVERLLFLLSERSRRDPPSVENTFQLAEAGKIDAAAQAAASSRDFVARVLAFGLQHRDTSFSNALLRAANRELKRFNRGLSTLDTVITLAPLLGLLGTVTGMIHAFGLLGNQELSAPAAITGGIAQALIATAFGLGIAILALIPFNYLNARQEEARLEIEDAASQLELLLASQRGKE
jgi:biopolymer transport protein ExbB